MEFIIILAIIGAIVGYFVASKSNKQISRVSGVGLGAAGGAIAGILLKFVLPLFIAALAALVAIAIYQNRRARR